MLQASIFLKADAMSNDAPISRLMKTRQWCQKVHDKIDDMAGKVLGMSGEDVRRFDEQCAKTILAVSAVAVSINAVSSLADGHSIINHLPGDFYGSVGLGSLVVRALFHKSPVSQPQGY